MQTSENNFTSSGSEKASGLENSVMEGEAKEAWPDNQKRSDHQKGSIMLGWLKVIGKSHMCITQNI